MGGFLRWLSASAEPAASDDPEPEPGPAPAAPTALGEDDD
jgi:hypothetical protein